MKPGVLRRAMCEDCEGAGPVAARDAKECACTNCNVGGSVVAINRPAGDVERGLAPWCVSCHHFILTGRCDRGDG